MLVRVGSRGSRLALVQAEHAAASLRRAGHEVAFLPITTTGDRDRSSPFGQIGERGVFVKELEEALLAGRIDVAVHSAKDMTSTDTAGLRRRCLPRARGPARRADRRLGDSRRDADRHSLGAPPGAASGARARRSRSSRCAATSTRGCARPASEGSTRSCSRRAVSTGSASADEIGLRVPVEMMLPEAGQGALALQVRAGEEELVLPARRHRDGAASARPSALALRRSAPAASRLSPCTTTERRCSR